MLRECKRQRRFPARGGAGDDDDVLLQLSASFEASLREAPQDEGFSLCHPTAILILRKPRSGCLEGRTLDNAASHHADHYT
jgi:hypothetical protein